MPPTERKQRESVIRRSKQRRVNGRGWKERALDSRDPREIAEFRAVEYYRYFGDIGLTLITGGLWLLVLRWWRRRNNRGTDPDVGIDSPIQRR